MSDNTSGGGGSGGGGSPGEAGWYDLFSRGARDWLRHNDKVRDAVRQHLPQIVAGADVLNGGATTVRVPVRMLEHYRFKLRSSNEQQGVGQGQAKPGDRIGRPQQDSDNQRGQGGNEDGSIQYTLEFRIDDIVDWLWEEMQLPNLEAKAGRAKEDEWTREGWDRRGARSRLDRRRSMKESIKRRGMQSASGARVAHLHRRRSALSPAHQARAAGDAGRRDPVARRLGQHGRARAADLQDLLLLGDPGPAPPVPSSRSGVRRAHLRSLGVPGRGILPRHRHRRHGRLGRPEESARDHRRALQPEPVQRLSVLRLRRRELPLGPAAGAGRARRAGRATATSPASWKSRRSPAPRRTARSAGCSSRSRATRTTSARTASAAPTTSGTPCGTSSAELRK